MSKILSYNNKTTGEGWIPLSGQYNADEIEMIADPDGGLTQTPRTAIPSPFAQMDLVKNAFRRLAMHTDLKGDAMDENLVSNALDVAQLIFNFHETRNMLRIVEWRRREELDQLLNNRSHRLLGETLEMFLNQDQEAFNFDKMDRLYFFVYGSDVIGSTSPVSLFMATPNARKGKYNIPIEQNVLLFNQWRPLHEREARFVVYLYALFTAYPELKQWCGEVNAYLIRAFHLLPDDTRTQILKDVGNPQAMDLEAKEHARSYLAANLDEVEGGIQALGIPFYCAREQDIEQDIEASDFMMLPSKAVADEKTPLVLQNHLNATKDDALHYIGRVWDDSIVIRPADYAPAPENRTLPGTTHQYPWLTDDDFFEPVILKLNYAINAECFFDGNVKNETADADSNGLLLPLKPLYFKYFTANDLQGTINGQPRFELRHSRSGSSETVKAILRIPIQKTGRFVTLSRTYVQATDMHLGYDEKRGTGVCLTLPFALSVFPFIRTQAQSRHHVQLIDRAIGPLEKYNIALSFYADSRHDQPIASLSRSRSIKTVKKVGSLYYQTGQSFDYIRPTLTDELGNIVAQGIVCPRWASHVEGHEAFTFAVDFGTTNTHIESVGSHDMPSPLHVEVSTQERMVASLYNGQNMLYDVIIRQEFLPRVIGAQYGFPQRTVLSESEHLNAEQTDTIMALGDANIPFIYEKESVGYGNRIIADLKWSTDMSTHKRIRAYLSELAQLMRSKVLLSNGDLEKTRVVWFYPLSMKLGKVRKMEELWAKTFSETFGVPADEKHLIQMPESVAPYYYYKCSSSFRGAASNVVSIDIGGGSSDVAVFEPGNDMPTLLTSFRFAANVLFGDGFSEIPHGDSNPMVQKYATYFRQIFDSDDDRYGELNGILDDIMAKRKSEDINAFLFSVENNKETRGNEVFSYNKRLNDDEQRKIIFLYFYSAIVYYVARMMHHRELDMPRSLMFSGTGSKVLDILGSLSDIEILSQKIFEMVYGRTYGDASLSIVMERNEPKQITCRGALLQTRDASGCQSVSDLNKRMSDFDRPLKYNYTMTAHEQLTYDDMETAGVRQEVAAAVREFNDFFLALCDTVRVSDRFLASVQSVEAFRELVSKDIEHHLVTGWRFFNKNQTDRRGADQVEDAVFFYPIIGIIRDNLIENLK